MNPNVIELAISGAASVQPGSLSGALGYAGLAAGLIHSPKFKTTIGVIALDASLTERHLKKNVITGHPIESGRDVSDHIRHLPDEIEITGAISNTPIMILPSFRARSPVAGDSLTSRDRAKRADEAFIKAMDEGYLILVSTSLRDYKNMAIESYSVTRDKETSNILSFTIGLKQVVVVETVQVFVPTPVDLVNAPPTDAGVQSTGPARPTSALHDALEAGGAAENHPSAIR